MLRILSLVTALFLVLVSGASHSAQAQSPDMSHLKIVTGAPHGGDHVDTVINGPIEVRITIRDLVGNRSDWGMLTLRPGASPEYSWTCTSCPNGFFHSVHACSQAGGCQSGDVNGWLVGVRVGGSPWGYVNYYVDSDWMGDGYRYHPDPPDCNTAVSPVDDTYSATDVTAGWDAFPYCSDKGVSITLAYH